MKSDTFSLNMYRDILEKAKKFGYRFPRLSDYRDWIDKYQRFLLVRHDVDISPLNAAKMAEIEHSIGISTTYCLRVHSIFYNVSAPPFYDAIRDIVEMGHEIGLHYDAAFYDKAGMAFSKGIKAEAGYLEALFGIKVRTVSQHKP
ncbi:MAG: hypothetical protein JW800_06850, partial [Candidatus Omnitrophica bacterium]|nr:hypothetical protein [Candidatus Omnitrophota bacterium]